mgnify:FL=1
MLLRPFPLQEVKHDQVTFDGITTKAFDICPGAVSAFKKMTSKLDKGELITTVDKDLEALNTAERAAEIGKKQDYMTTY